MVQRNGAGIRGFSAAIGSGSSRMTAAKVSSAEPRRNAHRPVAIS